MVREGCNLAALTKLSRTWIDHAANESRQNARRGSISSYEEGGRTSELSAKFQQAVWVGFGSGSI
jgi:hypothetical protein